MLDQSQAEVLESLEPTLPPVTLLPVTAPPVTPLPVTPLPVASPRLTAPRLQRLGRETIEDALPKMILPSTPVWAPLEAEEPGTPDLFTPLQNLFLGTERITGGVTAGRTASSLNGLPTALRDTSLVQFELRYAGVTSSPPALSRDEALTDWEPRQTWVIIHGWNGSPETFEATADAINRARAGQDAVLLLDWREAAQNSTLLRGGNYNAATWISSVADWAAEELREWGISDANAQTHLNFVGHSLGALMSSEIASRFENGVNTIFALDPASEFNTISNSGYDFDNNGVTERPVRFDEVSRLSRAFVGNRSTAGNQEVAGWAHESFNLDYGFSLFGVNEHVWVYETFTQFIDEDSAIADSIGVTNLEPITDVKSDVFRDRHEGQLVVNDDNQLPEQLTFKSSLPQQDERIYGTLRNDRLSGNDGNDWILADAGNDRLLGGDGNDTLIGGKGRDEMSGGSGRDRFEFAAGDGARSLAQADVITDFFTGNGSAASETIVLGQGLMMTNLQIESGVGTYRGDTIVRHGNEFLVRLENVSIQEISIARTFVQL